MTQHSCRRVDNTPCGLCMKPRPGAQVTVVKG